MPWFASVHLIPRHRSTTAGIHPIDWAYVEEFAQGIRCVTVATEPIGVKMSLSARCFAAMLIRN